MITSLIGTIPATTADMVDNKTKLRFVDRNQFKTPEALIIHEQQIISDDKLLDACCMEYNLVLYTPQSYYVPKDVLDDFEQYDCVVINYDAREREVTLGIMPENKDQIILSDRYKIKRLLVPIYYYVDLRTKEYGEPDFLNELPVVDKWDFIVDEAIKLQASDITLTNTIHGAKVYYNVRKHKVHSKRTLKYNDVNEICALLASRGGATMADFSAKPRFFAIEERVSPAATLWNFTSFAYLASGAAMASSRSSSFSPMFPPPPTPRSLFASTDSDSNLFL